MTRESPWASIFNGFPLGPMIATLSVMSSCPSSRLISDPESNTAESNVIVSEPIESFANAIASRRLMTESFASTTSAAVVTLNAARTRRGSSVSNRSRRRLRFDLRMSLCLVRLIIVGSFLRLGHGFHHAVNLGDSLGTALHDFTACSQTR